MERSLLQPMNGLALALGALFLAPLPTASAQSGNIAIRAGKIITNTGEVIEEGTILVDRKSVV